MVLAHRSRAQLRLAAAVVVLDFGRHPVDPGLHHRGDDLVHPHPPEVRKEVAVQVRPVRGQRGRFQVLRRRPVALLHVRGESELAARGVGERACRGPLLELDRDSLGVPFGREAATTALPAVRREVHRVPARGAGTGYSLLRLCHEVTSGSVLELSGVPWVEANDRQVTVTLAPTQACPGCLKPARDVPVSLILQGCQASG